MTTWEECSYVDDMLTRLSIMSPNEDEWASYLWEKFGYQDFDYGACNIKEKHDIKSASGMKKAYPNFGKNKDKWFMENIKGLILKHDKVLTGNEAIYEIVSLIYNSKIESHREMQFGKIKDLTRTMLQVNLLGSLTTPKKIAPLIDELLLRGEPFRIYANLLQTASALQHLAFYWRSDSHSEKTEKSKRSNLPIPEVPRNSIDFGKNVTAYTYPGVQILSYQNSLANDKILFMFTNKQMRRLEITIRALSKAIFYYYTTYSQLPNVKNVITNLMDMFVESMVKTKRYNEVARAWDIMFNIYLAHLASDITDLSFKLQYEKLIDGKYDKIVSWEAVKNIIGTINRATALDLLKMYKILPAPDFNPSTGFVNIKKYHDKPHTFGELTQKQKDEFPFLNLNVNEFKTFQKLQLLRRLHRKFSYLPLSLSEEGKQYLFNNPDSELSHFPRCRPNHLTNTEIELISFAGEADYEELLTNGPSTYIDKACSPQGKKLSSYKDASHYYEEKIYNRNYAAWYIHQNNVPTTDEIRTGFLQGDYSNNQMAFFKPEAKKPEPRNFYSATPYQRIIMTEFENNVSRYLSHDVASFQSKDPKERAEALSVLLGEEFLSERRRLVLISFDLEKFSPCMNEKAKDLSMDLWIEFFGRKSMKAVKDVYKNVDLHFMHHGLHQSYVGKSVDMEGQNGKTNTCYHEDVMAFAVRMLRRYDYLQQAAKLAVFIDDGLLALALPLETTNEKIMKIVRLIDAVYTYFGLKISFDKTFISQKICTFLNEIYIDNEYVNIGFKAILKLQLSKVQDEISISGKTRALVTMARASMVNGVLGHIVYSELTKELYALHGKTFITIDRSVRTQEAFLVSVLWVHTPVSMGGLGVPFMCNLEASPSTDPITEFICAAEYLSGAVPFLEIFLKRIFAQQFKQRSSLAILRAPQSLRVQNHVFTEHKHIGILTKVVENFSNNTTLNKVIRLDFHSEAEKILGSLGANAELWEITCSYKMSNINILDSFIGKFKRSSTLMSMLSFRSKMNLIRKYKTEENLVIQDFLSLYHV